MALLCLLPQAGGATPQEATNGILKITIENDPFLIGLFTVRTGSSHPSPNRNVFYDTIGTSYLTLRDDTAKEMWINQSAGGIVQEPGLPGYTLRSTNEVPATLSALGPTGFRTTYNLPSFVVVQDVVIEGTIVDNTYLRQTVTVTNVSGVSRQIGLRLLWDLMVNLADASYFRTRDPDTAFTNVFTNYASPAFLRYEVADSAISPTFSIFGTTSGGALLVPPTPPEELRYASWALASRSAWSFTNTGQADDSAVVYFWGKQAPLSMTPGQSRSFVQYVTTGNINALRRSVPTVHLDVSPPGIICRGEQLTYTVSFSNSGDATCWDLTIFTDTLPVGVLYEGSSLEMYAQPDSEGSPALKSAQWAMAHSGPWADGEPDDGQGEVLLRWVVDRVAPGGSGYVSFRTTVTATAFRGSALPFRGWATNYLDATVFSTGEASSEVQTIGTYKYMDVGSTTLICSAQEVTMRVMYANSCDKDTAFNVVIDDPVVPEISYLSCQGGASCWSSGGSVHWDMGDLPPGATGEVTYQATYAGAVIEVDKPPNAALLSYSSSTGIPVVIESNQFGADYRGSGLTFRKTAKLGGRDAVNPGDQFEYVVTVSNDSCTAITDLVIWDTLPAGVTLVDPKGGIPKDGGSWVVWQLVPDLWGPIGPGEASGVEMTVQVTNSCEDVEVNRAEYTCVPNVGGDPLTYDPEEVVRVTRPEIDLFMEPDNYVPTSQSQVTYTIVVTSIGQDTARSVAIWDTPPGGLTYVGCAGGATCWWDGDAVTWLMGDMPPGASASVFVTTTVTSTGLAIGPGVSWASYSNLIGCTYFHDQSNDVLLWIGQPLVTIVQNAYPDPVGTGHPLAYSFQVANVGVDTAYNITMWDMLPADLEYVGCTGGSTCYFDGTSVQWEVPPLVPGQGANVSFTVTVTGTGPTVGPSTAFAGYENSGFVGLPAAVSNTVVVNVGKAILKVSKSANQDSVPEGSLLTYRLTLTNTGELLARTIIVWDSLPPGALFVSCSGGNTCWHDGDKVVWGLPDMPPADMKVLSVSVTPTGALAGGNFAEGDYYDSGMIPQPTIMSNTVFVAVVNPALVLQKYPERSAYASGERVVYTIRYTNTGTGKAEKLFIWDTMPDGWVFLSSTPTAGQMGDMRFWSAGTLVPGASSTITYTVVPPAVGCEAVAFGNSVTMRYENAGFVRQEARFASAPDVTVTMLDLALTMTPSAWVVPQGSSLDYTIGYESVCSDTAWNVSLRSAVPDGASYGGCVAPPGGGCGLDATQSWVEWSLPSVPPAASGEVSFSVVVRDKRPSVGPVKAYADFTSSAAIAYTAESNPVTVLVTWPQLALAKHGPIAVETRTPFSFTFTVTNSGTSAAYDVVIVDTLPYPLRFVSAAGAPAVSGNVVAWIVPDLGPGEVYRTEVTVRGPNDDGEYVVTNQAAAGFWTRSSGGVAGDPVYATATVNLRPTLILRVFPNPYDPGKAVRGTLKFSGLPNGSEVMIYTISGMQVRRLAVTGPAKHRVEWDGTNERGSPVAPGLYLYIVEMPTGGGKKRELGKFALIR